MAKKPNKKPQFFNEKWQSYAKQVVRDPEGSEKYESAKCAFYAGGSVIMGAVKATGEPDIPEDAGVWLLESLEEELREFMEQAVAIGAKARAEMKRRAEGN